MIKSIVAPNHGSLISIPLFYHFFILFMGLVFLSHYFIIILFYSVCSLVYTINLFLLVVFFFAEPLYCSKPS